MILALKLESREEEQLLSAFCQRSSDVEPGKVEAVFRFPCIKKVVPPVAGVKYGVAGINVSLAVKIRCSGLGHCVKHHRTQGVFRREVRGLDLDLLKHVHVRRHGGTAVASGIDHVGPVGNVGNLSIPGACHVVVPDAAIELNGKTCGRAGVVWIRVDDTRQDFQKLIGAASEYREILNLAVGDNLGLLSGVHWDDRCAGGYNFNLLLRCRHT